MCVCESKSKSIETSFHKSLTNHYGPMASRRLERTGRTANGRTLRQHWSAEKAPTAPTPSELAAMFFSLSPFWKPTVGEADRMQNPIPIFGPLASVGVLGNARGVSGFMNLDL